jgi:hypothetical protein
VKSIPPAPLIHKSGPAAIVLLSALADYDPARLRRAALQVADELADRQARAFLLDAAADAVIEGRRPGR